MHILLTELLDIKTRLANLRARRDPNAPQPNPKTYTCPKCKGKNARLRSMHEDTDMECMELRCPDCGHDEEDPSPELLKESKTFQQIKDEEDPDGQKHDLTLTCEKCGKKETCRCSKPKRQFTGICQNCSSK